jgi:hypothetical protein
MSSPGTPAGHRLLIEADERMSGESPRGRTAAPGQIAREPGSRTLALDFASGFD